MNTPRNEISNARTAYVSTIIAIVMALPDSSGRFATSAMPLQATFACYNALKKPTIAIGRHATIKPKPPVIESLSTEPKRSILTNTKNATSKP